MYNSYPTNGVFITVLNQINKYISLLMKSNHVYIKTGTKQATSSRTEQNQIHNYSTHSGDCHIPLLTPRAHLKHSLSNLYTGERISKNFKILSSLLRLANCRNVCWINFRSVLACVLKCLKINYFKSNQ